MDKRRILEDLNLGSRVAEDEVEQLAAYFVETDQWRKVESGDADVIFGAKGSGKSAIYSTLLTREGDLFDHGVIVVSAENPRGTPAFRSLVVDPPASEAEFIGLWKLYSLSLIGRVFREYGFKGDAAKKLFAYLEEGGLLPASKSTLSSIARSALDYVVRVLRPTAIEAETHFDPHTGAPTAVRTKIFMGEPTVEEKKSGSLSVDDLMRLANETLEAEGWRVWLLFDRLDVAFSESRELEANALRALFKMYLDIPRDYRIAPKIFLRTDIWRDITRSGFRELSHVSRSVTISWGESSLLLLVVQRLLQNEILKQEYGIVPEEVLATASKHREFFQRLVPEQVDTGRNPQTFEWLLGRARDGTRLVAPRELIHLISQARDVQLSMLERGEEEPRDEMLFTRQALRDALPEVSRVRLTQTLFAEYPDLKPYLDRLEEEKTEQTPISLARIWSTDAESAVGIAMKLVDVGFFERRGEKDSPNFWVPFLYRPALRMVQGADRDEELVEQRDVIDQYSEPTVDRNKS